MSYVLNLVYLLVLLAAAPWLAYRSLRTGKYREGFAAKFLGLVPRRTSHRTCIWLHAVSVGEVNLLAPLITELRRRHPDLECVISTTTITGFQLAQKKYSGLTVFYCPLDFSWAVNRAMRRIHPSLFVLAELELWPNLIQAARRHGAKVAVVNGRLSEHSFRGYRRLRPLISRLLNAVDLLAVQNEEYADRFLALGAPAERVHVTGSLKFDGAETDRNNPATLRLTTLGGFKADDVVVLAGSTQEPEESLALKTFRELAPAHPALRLVLVPRHAERFDSVAQLLERSGLRWQRRSEIESLGLDTKARVLLVDTIGELGAWWGTAHVALVGGSFGTRGGQNMIEPAAYGAAVCFGPNTRNFRDVVAALLASDAAVVVHDGRELTTFVRHCLEDPQFALQLGLNAKRLVVSQVGATRRTAGLLEAALDVQRAPEADLRAA